MKDYGKCAEAFIQGKHDELWHQPSAYWHGGGKPKYMQCDFETYCSVDLAACGSYRYIEDDSFEPLLLAVAFDDHDVFIVDLACGEPVPDVVWAALFDDDIIKTAWNAQFERTIFGRMVGHRLSPDTWRCTMVWAASLSLPLALKNAALVLNASEQKDKAGETLIRFFSIPCHPTKANGERSRNLPEHAPEEWQRFKAYCAQDVRTERDIRKQLEQFPMPDAEWDYYHMDQRINDYGVLIDRTLVEQAIVCDQLLSDEMMKRAYEITGLENPNSVAQLKLWLAGREVCIDTLERKGVASQIDELIKNHGDPEVIEMLKLRLLMAKSSVKKYQAAERCVCRDGRARGLFQFYGANRTGRFAGRNIQLQNLPQNFISTLSEARSLVKMGCFDLIESIYGNTPDTLSQLIRTMLIPGKGKVFVIADFSAIEARVLAWLADEAWRLTAFRKGTDIYCASASKMFSVPVEKHGINGELRQKGKVAELACGYGGGTGALISMGALKKGVDEEDLQSIIRSWREANPNVVQFWHDLEHAAIETVRWHKEQKIGKLRTSFAFNTLWVHLPSGRKLAYRDPKIQPNRYGQMAITFEGQPINGQPGREETYSGKLTENCTQAVARDILVEAMMRLEKAGFQIVAHVHDEVIIESPRGKASVKAVCDLMNQVPVWGTGLPLSSAGYIGEEFYYKD